VQAQGWYRDPYGVHGDRWMSGGQPTHLVRDEWVESYHAPPPREPPGPLIPVAAQQMTGGRPARTPGMWGSWTLWPPCLLTLPIAGLHVLGLALPAAMNCFGSCGQPGAGWGVVAAVGEVALAVITVSLLVAGLPLPTYRRAIALASWAVCALANAPLAWALLNR
jgi:hypothetical protein